MHELRTHLFRIVYEQEVKDDYSSLSDIAGMYFESSFPISGDDDDETHTVPEVSQIEIVDRAEELNYYLGTIDKIIRRHSRGWKLERLGKAELAILRVAVYEIYARKDTPDSVAIDEAVELAKTYCSDRAASFVNGILGAVEKEKKMLALRKARKKRREIPPEGGIATDRIGE